ncbi:FKBP-type peptidyl-prolyl cis-trans isomerase [Serratia marcescens]|uniref:peptidylprolyl isomerase n=1 Tax=Serratia marcescens TaxID=615 RepID=A0A939SNS7_SERMA|nr:FKBP-type peptidyl-prolyl cis-trans isomerase [Serratia marcescens]
MIVLEGFLSPANKTQRVKVSNMTAQVISDSAVLVHFTLKLEDGSTAESTRSSGKPALFHSVTAVGTAGAQLLACARATNAPLPCRSGVRRGEPGSGPVLLAPRLRGNRRVPDVGTIMLFTAIDGSEMPGVVRAVAEDSITVDFNHPLAGHPVTFDIEVLEIDPQQEEMHANIAG